MPGKWGAFLPKGSLTGPSPLQSSYSTMNNSPIYILSASRSNSDAVLGVDINTIGVTIKTGMTIALANGNIGEGIGAYTNIQRNGSPIVNYRTNTITKGELKITRFDELNRIGSGTFWFDAVNENGEKVEVREGRFDMKF